MSVAEIKVTKTGVRYRCRICNISKDTLPDKNNPDEHWDKKLPKDWTEPKTMVFVCGRCSGNHNY